VNTNSAGSPLLSLDYHAVPVVEDLPSDAIAEFSLCTDFVYPSYSASAIFFFGCCPHFRASCIIFLSEPLMETLFVETGRRF